MSHKIVLLGDAKSGKSSLLKRLITDKFDNNYQRTVGSTFEKIDDLQVWDTSGTYKNFAEKTKEGAELFVYCLNLSQPLNETVVRQDLQNIKVKYPHVPILLVGTHGDLDRKIQDEELNQLATEFTVNEPIVTSAKSDNLDALKLKNKLNSLVQGDLNSLALEDLAELGKKYIKMQKLISKYIDLEMLSKSQDTAKPVELDKLIRKDIDWQEEIIKDKEISNPIDENTDLQDILLELIDEYLYLVKQITNEEIKQEINLDELLEELNEELNTESNEGLVKKESVLKEEEVQAKTDTKDNSPVFVLENIESIPVDQSQKNIEAKATFSQTMNQSFFSKPKSTSSDEKQMTSDLIDQIENISFNNKKLVHLFSEKLSIDTDGKTDDELQKSISQCITNKAITDGVMKDIINEQLFSGMPDENTDENVEKLYDTFHQQGLLFAATTSLKQHMTDINIEELKTSVNVYAKNAEIVIKEQTDLFKITTKDNVNVENLDGSPLLTINSQVNFSMDDHNGLTSGKPQIKIEFNNSQIKTLCNEQTLFGMIYQFIVAVIKIVGDKIKAEQPNFSSQV